MATILQARRNNPPAGFDSCIRVLRRFAHSRGLVVAGPARLLGAERTGYGDSDAMEEGPTSHRLINSELLFEGLWISKKARGAIEEIADVLLEMSELDIKDCFAPPGARLPTFEDERGRWYLKNSRGHDVGLVVRTGEGSSKRYMLHLWDGLWYLAGGAPPYDLPVFGLPELLRDRDKPVMIHEGPKAWQGALAAADGRVSTARLANWMSLYTHIGWHGSDAGIEWTDWSPLKGRRVLIWSDMDETGVSTAIMLARRLARMGGIVEYLQWGKSDIEGHEGWDWADPMTAGLGNMTRYDIRERTRQIESPFDVEGNVHPSWARRSFIDAGRGEVYQASTRYEPLPLQVFNTQYGAGSAKKIMDSPILPYMGRTFRPGLPFGVMQDGRVNTCPPNNREPMTGRPLDGDFVRILWRRWLAKMIPDVRQRKHLLRKAAWAIARPHKVSQHMVIMRGPSGIGKSVFMDVLCAVAGKDRAGAVYPDSIFKNFNDSIKDKCLVCIHEIHSDDISRKQNASRLKELVGNSHITIREKYRSDENRENAIHWFGATNENVPFAMENGNDRFYFVECVAPRDGFEKRKRDKFFEDYIPIVMDPLYQDVLYSAAKWLVSTFSPETCRIIMGRAQRQQIWKYMERRSLRPWEQRLLNELKDLEDSVEGREQPLVFFGNDMVRIITKEFGARIGVDDVRARMNEMGYKSLRLPNGRPVQRRVGGGRKEVLWCRAADHDQILKLGDVRSLIVDSLFGEARQGD